MGGHAWTYFVPYQPDILAAMQALRRREFEAGRYNPAVRFPMDRNAPSPGAQHDSIEEALTASEADGTRSILIWSGSANRRITALLFPCPSSNWKSYMARSSPRER